MRGVFSHPLGSQLVNLVSCRTYIEVLLVPQSVESEDKHTSLRYCYYCSCYRQLVERFLPTTDSVLPTSQAAQVAAQITGLPKRVLYDYALSIKKA